MILVIQCIQSNSAQTSHRRFLRQQKTKVDWKTVRDQTEVFNLYVPFSLCFLYQSWSYPCQKN